MTVLNSGEKTTITVPAGKMPIIVGARGTSGSVHRLNEALGGNAASRIWGVGEGAVEQIGPFATSQTYLVVCSLGSIDVTVGSAAPGLALTASNAPFAGYVAMIPCAQAVLSGSAKSLAGHPLAEAYPAALVGRGALTDAQMWANAGYMSTANIAGGQIEISLAAYAPNLKDGQGQLIAFTVNAAPPAANTALIAQSNGATSPNLQGFSLTATTAGKISVSYASQANGGNAFALGTSAATFCDNTDRSGAFFIHPSGYAVLWNPDGEIDTVFSINPAVPLGITTPTAPLTIGANPTVGTNGNTAMALKMKGLHVIAFDTLPLNLNQMVKRIKADPVTPLRNSDVLLASKSMFLYWTPGQSNESGAGNTAGVTGPYGVPDRDPYASGRSVKTGLAKRLALRGIAALWGNSAVGSTSVADSWCGRIRNWVTNSNVVKGTYMLSGGTVYKCTAPDSANSTTALAAGTGADGITWASLGAATAEDTAALAGTGVYGPTSARFDPNGYLAAAEARAALAAPSVSECVGIISLGQGDRFVGTPRAAYADAIVKSAQYALSHSAKRVFIGMTVRTAVTADYSAINGGGAASADNDTANHWYDRQLMPGRLDALAALSNDTRVYVGHDWATDIGIVTSQTSPTGIGVKSSDGLVHMTDATYESKAVPSLDAALMAGGL